MKDNATCRWCHNPVAQIPGPGRTRLFCSQPCRQADYDRRKKKKVVQVSRADLHQVLLVAAGLRSAEHPAVPDIGAMLERYPDPDNDILTREGD